MLISKVIKLIFKLGLDVRGFVRDEAKIPENLRAKVESFVGDVTNPEEVAKAIAGREGVVVVLGTRNDLSEFQIKNNLKILSKNIFF